MIMLLGGLTYTEVLAIWIPEFPPGAPAAGLFSSVCFCFLTCKTGKLTKQKDPSPPFDFGAARAECLVDDDLSRIHWPFSWHPDVSR